MKSKRKPFLVVIIAVLLGYQAVVSWTSYIRPITNTIWGLRGEPAWARTGAILVSDRFAGHLGLLRELLPDESRVVLPPHSGGGVYEHIGFMQYFLIPRDIINCGPNEVEECVRRVSGRSTYILSAGNFPPREVAEETKRYIEYDNDLGVYVPK